MFCSSLVCHSERGCVGEGQHLRLRLLQSSRTTPKTVIRKPPQLITWEQATPRIKRLFTSALIQRPSDPGNEVIVSALLTLGLEHYYLYRFAPHIEPAKCPGKLSRPNHRLTSTKLLIRGQLQSSRCLTCLRQDCQGGPTSRNRPR